MGVPLFTGGFVRTQSVTIVAALILAMACSSRSVTPSGAQVADAQPTVATPTAATLYLINGKELAPGHTLQELDPRTITSVEHFIGVAARLRGAGPGRDVIVIATNDTLTAARITKP